MNTTSELTHDFRQALEHPADGVVGLINSLLAMCQEHGLQIDWRGDVCCISGDGHEERIETRLHKSVLRAVLARLATLCNECKPGSVSLFGGTGELSLSESPNAAFRVSFGNTQDEQWLKLTAQARS